MPLSPERTDSSAPETYWKRELVLTGRTNLRRSHSLRRKSMRSRHPRFSLALASSLIMLLSLGLTAFGQQTSPLAENENPELIGKRNINKHQINFYSLDKEVAMGRQFATEVDRSAKFVEDPVIVEYINRVGQNLVLHSD